MIRDIANYFKSHKLAAAIFVLNLLVYGFLFSQKFSAREPESPSQAMENFKQAEESLQKKIEEKGSIEAFLKDKPGLAAGMQVMSLLLIVALGAGLTMDILYLVKPAFREKISRGALPVSERDWKFSLLFNVINGLLFFNLPLTLGLGAILHLLKGTQNIYLLAHTTLLELFCFWFILKLLKQEGASAADLGLRLNQGKWFQEMLSAWTVYLGTLPIFAVVLTILLIVTKILNYEPPPHPLVNVFLEEEKRTPWLIYYSLILASFFGPLFEEIFFRGLCYPIFKKKMGKIPAMVLVSAFFALIHDNTFAFWPVFVLGMALVFLYEKRGSLLASMTMHITHNAIFLSYFFLAKEFISAQSGG